MFTLNNNPQKLQTEYIFFSLERQSLLFFVVFFKRGINRSDAVSSVKKKHIQPQRYLKQVDSDLQVSIACFKEDFLTIPFSSSLVVFSVLEDLQKFGLISSDKLFLIF